MYYFVFQEKTVFVPFREIYPECFYLIKGEQYLFPLKCMEDVCYRNSNCAEILAKRVSYFFDNVIPEAKLLVAYFKYEDRPESIRAGLFYKEMEEPRIIVCNKAAFAKFRKEGIVYKWNVPQEFRLLGGSSDIIPVENIIKK